MNRYSLATSLCLASLSTLAPSLVYAQSASVESIPANVRSDLARTHFRTGMRYFDLGRFSEAAVEFERVFEFTGQSELLYNIARSHESAGNLQRALETYDQFVQREPSAPNASAIRAHADELRARVRSESAAHLQRPAPSSSPSALRCADGSAPTASDDSTPASSANTASAARAPQASALPMPLLQLRTRVVYERSAVHEVGPWVLGSAGLILAGFGAWQSVNALQQTALIDRANRSDPAGWTIPVQDAYDRAPTSTALAWGLSASGGCAIAGAVAWLLARGPGARRELVVAAVPSAGGAVMLSAGGRF
ncbi:MAG: tetratricopeptide repeat protein [Polyangiales bacterium]